MNYKRAYNVYWPAERGHGQLTEMALKVLQMYKNLIRFIVSDKPQASQSLAHAIIITL